MFFKMQHLLVESPYSPIFVNALCSKLPPPQPADPHPTCNCLPGGSVGCMRQCLRAACQVHSCDPYGLSCSHRRESRAWRTRERVLPELSRDEGAKNCCGSSSPSGSTICASGLGIPSRPRIIFRIDGGLPDHLAFGSI